MSNNYIFITLFCDDIRHEISGKASLMGTYGADMYVPDFPITIPKICAFFELRVPPNLCGISTDATISVMKGAEKINSITLPLASFDSAQELIHGKPLAFSRSTGGIEFSSMTFTEPTLLEVVVQIDSQSIIGGRLWVTKFPQIDEAKSESTFQSE